MSARILVTGASGTVGGATARLLTASGHAVRLLGRDAARLPDLGPRAEAVTGDFADVAALRSAMTGIHAVLVVTGDPRLPGHDANVVRAAQDAGVRHLVKLSALAVTDPGAQDLITCWQRAAEERVRASGLGWTLLRPRAFMTNTLAWADGIRGSGTVRAWPADASNACVDPRDVAHVAARALTEDGHAGQAYALTGPAAVTARQQAELLGRALGRPLAFEELAPEQVRRAAEARYGAEVAQALLESAERQVQGAKSRVDPALEHLLGRPGRTFEEWAREHASLFG
ncbi:NAD(P)H-binding protein [Streptomyces sp. NPDC046261]|uniref:NAD(P)H-binding protein n=1 Tax=Streptomyces sp. NPDC046261 TaxID=3157200 RepID=UPI0033E2EC9D